VFEVRYTYRLGAEFQHNFFGDAATRLGISWSQRSGVPYSAAMFDNASNSVSGRSAVFGTVNTSSHLLYVPDFGQTPVSTSYVNAAGTTVTGGLQVGNVIFADQATLTALQTLVKGTVLANYQGKIAPKNILTGPRFTKLDLNFAQEIPFFFHSKITALFAIENVLNLLDRNWGSYQEYGNTAVVRVACGRSVATNPAAGAQACPQYVYSVYTDPKTQTYPKASLWAIRAGVRFSF